MNRFVLPSLCGLALSLSLYAHADEAPRPLLHPLFSDGAVLQRDRVIPVWGFAKPGEQISLSLDGTTKASAKTDATGKWMARIGPVKAGTGHTLDVSGPSPDEKAGVKNIAFGDVWLCSGQSNMQMNFGWGIQNGDEERKAANYPNIRYFTVPNISAVRPRALVNTKWGVVTPDELNHFSAVGYFFGRELYQKTGVPIGLIDASWTASAAAPWVSGEAVEKIPVYAPGVATVRAARDDISYADQLEEWNQKYDPGYAQKWAAPAFDDSKWKSDAVPGAFTSDAHGDLTQFDGAVWYRKTVVVPATLANHDAQLSLGTIDDNDETFWDGASVGGMQGYYAQRSYPIPAAKMSAGRHVLTVRVFDTGGPGGLEGKPEEIKLEGSGQMLPLAGQWRLERSISFQSTFDHPVPVNYNYNINPPSVLFNGMIAPLTPFAIKGAIWYQGESNADHPEEYKLLLTTLIRDWRARFGSGDFPFYIVQLAAYQAPDTTPQSGDGSWATQRESQAYVARTVGHSGYSVTTDIGSGDIHPKNKQDVGKRLALLALANDYGQKIESSGPSVRSMKIEGDAIRLTLDHAEGGLTLEGDKNNVFVIAGEDKKWAWATPTIDGNTLVLRSPEVKTPVAVRFAWSNYPRGNVFNGAHLPMAPYRSDAQ